jgi:hypothetical protein
MFSMNLQNHHELNQTDACHGHNFGAIVRRTHPTFRSVGWKSTAEGRSSVAFLPETLPKTGN